MRGIPTTEAQRLAFVAAIRGGAPRTIAAMKAGMSRRTSYDLEDEPEFAAQVEAAEADRAMKHIRICDEADDPHVSLKLLACWHPESFGKQRVELTGKDGSAVQIETRPAAAMTDAEIAAELARLAPRSGDP